MKKITFIFICLICLIATGCTSKETKEVGSLDKFRDNCVNYGLESVDMLSDYQVNGVNYITGSIKCTLNDLTIEMVTYDNSDDASKIQTQHISSFMAIKGTAATANKDKGKNYYKFTMISNGYYMVSSRIENTLIFSKTPIANNETVEGIINNMGY